MARKGPQRPTTRPNDSLQDEGHQRFKPRGAQTTHTPGEARADPVPLPPPPLPWSGKERGRAPFHRA
eukprot:1325762-Pyramimonas_sp.AAC.1